MDETTRYFPVTFETITEDSAEQGDAADRGYLDWAGHRTTDCSRSLSWDFRSLVDALHGHKPEGDGGDPPRWLTFTAGNDDLIIPSGVWSFVDSATEIGAEVSIHRPDWITEASWRRVCRCLGWEPWSEMWARVGPAVERAEAARLAALATVSAGGAA